MADPFVAFPIPSEEITDLTEMTGAEIDRENDVMIIRDVSANEDKQAKVGEAIVAIVGAASEAVPGVVQLATEEETFAQSSGAKAVHPQGLLRYARFLQGIADIATLPAIAGAFYIVGIGAGAIAIFRGVSGSTTPDGYSRLNTAAAGVYLQRAKFAIESSDTVGDDYTMLVNRATAENADAIYGVHTSSGAAQGYMIHALDTGSSSLGDPYIFSKGNSGAGGAGGFATDRSTPADAIVANRRLAGDGSGVVGTRWETGNGNGLMGQKVGSGVGDGVLGYKVNASEGHAVRGINESTEGAGVYGHRNNGGGPGSGVAGWAQGSGGGGSLNPSVYGFKLSTDNGHAGFFESVNAAGSYPVLTASAFGGAYPALDASSTETNTSAVTAQVTRGNGLVGAAHKVNVSGGGARTGLVQGSISWVVPSAASTGASGVTAHDVQIGSNVTGSAEASCITVNNAAIGGASAIGVKSVVTGANTDNYAVYGNATGGTTNYSGYFVGNLFYGGSLIPSDSRLKTIHNVVDGAECLANVLACPVYCYDKYSAWDENVLDDEGNIIDTVEKRDLLAVNEIGPIAQELLEVTPDHVNTEGKYLAVSDRSELYQLKAAVQHLALKINSTN